ncbi:hypothetical protein Scep_025807 [Stephania cephalantha]|uniref:Uncharacterized protein n=1 Tax=Stephania cephalantha TaxID=152367 RepID=A0AAP0EPI6_9MAGN
MAQLENHGILLHLVFRIKIGLNDLKCLFKQVMLSFEGFLKHLELISFLKLFVKLEVLEK